MLEVKNINEVNIKNPSLDNVQLTIKENIFVTLTKLSNKTIITVIYDNNVNLADVISEDIDEFTDYLINVNDLNYKTGKELIPKISKVKIFSLIRRLAELNILTIAHDVESNMLKQEIERIKSLNEYLTRSVRLNEIDINELEKRLSRL